MEKERRSILWEMSGETLAVILNGLAWGVLAVGVVVLISGLTKRPNYMQLPALMIHLVWSMILFGAAVGVRLAVRLVTAIEKIAERVEKLPGQTEQG